MGWLFPSVAPVTRRMGGRGKYGVFVRAQSFRRLFGQNARSASLTSLLHSLRRTATLKHPCPWHSVPHWAAGRSPKYGSLKPPINLGAFPLPKADACGSHTAPPSAFVPCAPPSTATGYACPSCHFWRSPPSGRTMRKERRPATRRRGKAARPLPNPTPHLHALLRLRHPPGWRPPQCSNVCRSRDRGAGFSGHGRKDTGHRRACPPCPFAPLRERTAPEW